MGGFVVWFLLFASLFLLVIYLFFILFFIFYFYFFVSFVLLCCLFRFGFGCLHADINYQMIKG